MKNCDEMNEVGLLTIHQSVNCGASLQAAALYNAIRNLGHRPRVIDYRPRQFMSFMDESNKAERRTPRGMLKTALLGRRIERTRRSFEEYGLRWYPSWTERFNTFEELVDASFRFDRYICGSDQIWNPPHVRYDNSWMFGFVEKKPGVRIASYAASIGSDSLADREIEWLKAGLPKFDFIGVREDTAVSLLSQMGYTSVQCVDPVFLADPVDWIDQKRAPDIELPDRYIFYYPVDQNCIEESLLLELKRRHGMKCVAISDKLIKPKHADITVSGYSPEIFLHLLYNAEIVFTNSFHGLAFSIIFGKPLVSFRNPTKNSRLESLLRLAQLEGFQIDSCDALRANDPYEGGERLRSAYSEMGDHVERSRRYLADVLG